MPAIPHDSWMFLAPAAVLFYYLAVNLSLGRNPALGSVVTRYSPPEGLSPAAVRYIITRGSDFRTLAAVIAQLAARKCIHVQPLGGSGYKLSQLMADKATVQSLAPEESRLLQIIFDDGPEFTIDTSRATTLNMFASVLQEKLQKQLGEKYFTSHLGYVALGIFLSFITSIVFALIRHPKDTFTALFLTAWFFFCGCILGLVIAMTLVPNLLRAMRGLGGYKQVLIALAVVAGFGIGFGFVLRELARGVSEEFGGVLILLVAVNPICASMLRRYTAAGRDALGQIDGFRQFLLKAEQDRLQRLNHPEEVPASGLQYLPYAIALDIREAWGDHLATAVFGVPTSR